MQQYYWRSQRYYWENEGSDANDDDDSCNDDNSNMNSDNIITTEKEHTMQSMEQWNTQLACHIQIIYYTLTHVRHKTPLQIMMNYIYGKTRSKCIITHFKHCRSHN